jgi:4-amino-4-deoxy-L-arabinose transferase-like glycosyltransferase
MLGPACIESLMHLPSTLTRRLALALVVASALGSLAWLRWACVSDPAISFLPEMGRAEWIVSPSGADITLHPRLDLYTDFKRSFVLEKVPAQAGLWVAAFHQYSVTLNGTPPSRLVKRGKHWKEPDYFEVEGQLRVGENDIAIRVSNTNGPPALWLLLEMKGARLSSDENWRSSCAGAEPTMARLATKPKPASLSVLLSGGEEPWICVKARWRTLLLMALFSASGCWLVNRLRCKPEGAKSPAPNGESWRSELLPLVAMAAMWIALFVNNLGQLLPLLGFDVEGHLAYVNYIQQRHALPLPGQGWEMFQPPLYYAICAGLLEVLDMKVTEDGGVMALRVLGLGIGIAHLVIIWASLRLVFPENRARRSCGLVLAGCLPVLLYLSQYVTNEAAAAALVSAGVYLTLRALKQPHVSWKLCVALGICLGAALLTKITAVLLLPVVCGALFWKWLERPETSPWYWSRRLFVVLAICAALCGWHYLRVWANVSNSRVVAWIPSTEVDWWQDEGYRTSAFFLRFGCSLAYPWFSGFKGFADGMYSTFWGDGWLGGSGDLLRRPPWNYELMAIGYWLALLPTLGMLIGGVLAVAKFIRQPTAEWFLLLGLGFLVAFGVLRLTLIVPYCGVVKAFYGLPALVPLCAIGAWGLDFILCHSRKLRVVVCMLVGIWAIDSYAAFWIPRSSGPGLLTRARLLIKSGRQLEAAQLLQAQARSNPRSGETRSLLALVMMATGEDKAATEQAELAVGQNPEDANGRKILALALTCQNRIAEAIDQARTAVELAPGDALGYDQLAMLLVEQKRFEEVIPVARRGLGIAPFNADLRFALGSALVARGDTAEGILQVRFARAIAPNWDKPDAVLRATLRQQEKLDEAK